MVFVVQDVAVHRSLSGEFVLSFVTLYSLDPAQIAALVEWFVLRSTYLQYYTMDHFMHKKMERPSVGGSYFQWIQSSLPLRTVQMVRRSPKLLSLPLKCATSAMSLWCACPY